MYTLRGKIRYGYEAWWLVVDVDRSISDYYCHLYFLCNYKTKKLNQPLWGPHITVVRNEIPKKLFPWKKYDGKTIEFQVIPQIKSNENIYEDFRRKPLPNDVVDGCGDLFTHYWLNIVCPFLLDVREELGLSRNPLYPLHLTIGNNKNQEK